MLFSLIISSTSPPPPMKLSVFTDKKRRLNASPDRCDGWKAHSIAPGSAWTVTNRAWPKTGRHIPTDSEIRKRHQPRKLQPALRNVYRIGSADRLFLHGLGACRYRACRRGAI